MSMPWLWLCPHTYSCASYQNQPWRSGHAKYPGQTASRRPFHERFRLGCPLRGIGISMALGAVLRNQIAPCTARAAASRAGHGEPVGRSIQTASAPNSTERHQRYRFVSKIAHDAVGLEPAEGRSGFVRGSREPDSGVRTQLTLPMGRGYAERVTPRGGGGTACGADTAPCSRKCRRRDRHQECLDFFTRIDKNLPPDCRTVIVDDYYAMRDATLPKCSGLRRRSPKLIATIRVEETALIV